MPEQKTAIPDTPLFDRAGSIRGYRINKMAMALGQAENRTAFKADEEAYLDRFGLSASGIENFAQDIQCLRLSMQQPDAAGIRAIEQLRRSVVQATG